MTGTLLIVVGGVMALSQVFTPTPVQTVFALGVLLALAGVVVLCDCAQQ